MSRFERQSNNKFLFSNAAGRKESANDYSDVFTRTLEEVRMRAPRLIPASIDIEEGYGISRSFQRGSTSAAQNALETECSAADVDRNNGWRTTDRAGNKAATENMQALYTDT